MAPPNHQQPNQPMLGQQRQRSATMIIASSIGTAIVIIVIVALIGRQGTTQAETAAHAPITVASPINPANAEPYGRAWGPHDAPITIIEYADYECESCGYFAQTFEHELVTTFAHTGKVRFEIRNAPFHGAGARNAAEAAYCAAEQDRFWPMHNSLFLNQPPGDGRGMQAFNDERLIMMATALDMDTTAFQTCLTSDTYVQQVEDDYTATKAAAIMGTPTFLVNGKPYLGPQSVAQFRRIFAEVAPTVRFDP